jgi:hypothetical protein
MSIPFTCPHCGTTQDAADEHAGQTIPCAHCGKTVTVRAAAGKAPTSIGRSVLAFLSPSSLSWGVWFILAIILIDVFGVLLGLLLPAIQAAREASRRVECTKNLKTIGEAMQAYHKTYGRFPPAFVPDENGKPKHSWRVLLLPFLHEQALYAQYRFDEPWDGPHNMALAQQMPHVFRCPTDSPSDLSWTNYAMIVGPHAISTGATSRRLDDLVDRGAGKVMISEVANAGINWLEPRDLSVKDMAFVTKPALYRSDGHESGLISLHSNVVNMLLCDGTVKAVETTVNEKTLAEMLTVDRSGTTAERQTSP